MALAKVLLKKILTKLLDRYEGEVLYKNEDLKSYNKSYYEEIGVGFEMPVQFSKLTAEENINFLKGYIKQI